MANHIYLVGKSTSQKTALGEFRGGRVASHIYLVGKSASQKANSVCEVAGFRQNTRSASHSISLSYVVATAATLPADSSVSLKCTSEGRCFLAPLRRGQPFGRASVPKICATSLREMAEGSFFSAISHA